MEDSCDEQVVDATITTTNEQKCTICNNNSKNSCRQQLLSYQCPLHGAAVRAAILARNTSLQRAAAFERAKRIPKGRFREPNFKYEGDTVVIWDIGEFRRNSRWKQETLRKTVRKLKMKWHTAADTIQTTLRIKSSRKRFRRILQHLYEQLDQTNDQDPTTTTTTHQPADDT